MRIHQSPTVGNFNRGISWETPQMPEKWNPRKLLIKKLNLNDADYKKDYLTGVIERAEAKWQMKMKPHVLTKDEVEDFESGKMRNKSVKDIAQDFEANRINNSVR